MGELIRHKRTAMPGKVPEPGDLSEGEVALNTADGKLFTKRADGVVVGIIGAQVLALVAFEDISAGDFVNVFSDNGAAYVRRADGGPAKRPAHGFVKNGCIAGDPVVVTPLGADNEALASLAPGLEYFLSSTNPGAVQSTPANASGTLRQALGIALTANRLATINGIIVELA